MSSRFRHWPSSKSFWPDEIKSSLYKGQDQSADFARFSENRVCIILIFGSRLTDMRISLILSKSKYIGFIFSEKSGLGFKFKACVKRDSWKNYVKNNKQMSKTDKDVKKRQKCQSRQNHDFEPCSQGNQRTYTYTFDVYDKNSVRPC